MYERESIDNPCQIFIAVNPRNKQKQKRLQIKNKKMYINSIVKSKFSQLNDKRFYFSDGIVPLAFSHLLLEKLEKFKEELGQKIEAVNLQKKMNYLNLSMTAC